MIQRYVSLYRIGFGLLGLSAVITEIIALVHRGTFNGANFFSFFTIQSNLLCAAMLLIVGYVVLVGRQPTAERLLAIKGAITLYMVMTGIIFAILLAPTENLVLTAVPWDNIVLHYIMPLVMAVDWLFVSGRSTVTLRQSLLWLIFPAAYVIYSLIRGAIVGWYPYPFLNAATHGYTRVLLVIIVLLAFVLLASQALRLAPAKTGLQKN